MEQYNDFITAYDRIFHIRSDESTDEIFDLIKTIIVDKYKLQPTKIISSLFNAIKYNYRAVKQYIKILNQIFIKYSITPEMIDNLVCYFPPSLNFQRNEEGFCIAELDTDFEIRENDVQYMIMYDQIGKFKEYIAQNPIPDIKEIVKSSIVGNIIDQCAYYGSVNIFYFLHQTYNLSSNSTLENAIIGRNADIINESLKASSINNHCIRNAIVSHNNQFIAYMFEKNLININKINLNDIMDDDEVIYSQNIKSMFLFFEKNKNSIVPWCSSYPLSIELIKNEELDFSKLGRFYKSILYYIIL